jgi:hypothetical protein
MRRQEWSICNGACTQDNQGVYGACRWSFMYFIRRHLIKFSWILRLRIVTDYAKVESWPVSVHSDSYHCSLFRTDCSSSDVLTVIDIDFSISVACGRDDRVQQWHSRLHPPPPTFGEHCFPFHFPTRIYSLLRYGFLPCPSWTFPFSSLLLLLLLSMAAFSVS